jgi:hypothetical protein
MKIKNCLLLLQLLFLTFQTSKIFSQTKFIERQAGHIIYLTLPDYMMKTSSLNDVASMQYMNAVKEAYVVVIEDSKQDLEAEGTTYRNIKAFHDVVIETLKEEDKKAKETSVSQFDYNGNHFYQSDLSTILRDDNDKEIKVTYLVTYVESKTHFYQILCWSTTKNYKDLVADFKQIAKSIRD